MDTTLAIIFYACSGLATAGSLAATLAGARWRSLSLAAVAVGTAGALASLSAGLAALLALVALGGCALLIGALPPDPAGPADRPRRGRAGGPGLTVAVGAAMSLLLVAGLLLAVWRGSFAAGPYPGGWFGAAAVGRAFFARDALALEALAGMLLAALAGAAAAARARR